MQITTPSDLARTVKTRRQKLGLTQQDVAEAVGITRQSVARIERGSGATSFDTVLRVLEQLGLTLDATDAEQRTELPPGGISPALLSPTAIAAVNTVFSRAVPAPDGWQRALADTLRKARDTRPDSDAATSARRDRVAALDAALRAGDPDRANDNG